MNHMLDPAILFFVFGVLAGTVKSNLEIPPAISRFLSLYLLMALGLKGGFALHASGLTPEVGKSLLAAIALALIVPAIGYQVLRRWVDGFDAAAVAATYGSVSAVTFITAIGHLENQEIAFGGHMAAAMALMESPAIIMAVLMANALRRRAAGQNAADKPAASTLAVGSDSNGFSLGKVLHESFTDGAQLLLLGAMVVGLLTGETGQAAMQPFSGDLFKGMLCFFLLDMGLMAARNLPQVRGQSPWLLAYAVLGPLTHATLALGLAWLLHLPQGDATLLMVLAASASYIAVPAVLRYAIPEAKPSIYFGMSLGLTFPFNILLGIPLYEALAQRLDELNSERREIENRVRDEAIAARGAAPGPLFTRDGSDERIALGGINVILARVGAADLRPAQRVEVDGELLVAVVAFGRPFPHQVADPHAAAAEQGLVFLRLGVHIGLAAVVEVRQAPLPALAGAEVTPGLEVQRHHPGAAAGGRLGHQPAPGEGFSAQAQVERGRRRPVEAHTVVDPVAAQEGAIQQRPLHEIVRMRMDLVEVADLRGEPPGARLQPQGQRAGL